MLCTVCGIEGRVEHPNISGEECCSPNSDHGPCQGCKEIGDIDVEISQTRAVLLKLYLKRCDAKLKRNLHHDQLVRRLPVEVVSRIFVHCLSLESPLSIPMYESYSDPPSRPFRIKPTTLALAAVCQRWRQIAFATPRLWNVAGVKIGGRAVAAYANMTADWLGRSGRLPLSLDIYEERPRARFSATLRRRGFVDQPPIAFDFTPIFEAINAHMHRVKTLEVHLDAQYLPLLRSEAPVLQELYISVTSSRRGVAPRMQLADTSPSPQRVLLRDVSSGRIGLDWAGVTYFEAVSLFLVEAFELLQHTPQLTECKIGHIATVSTEPPVLPQISLPHLETLIFGRTPAGQGKLLGQLVTPALKTLESKADLRAISAFITRSKCELRRLAITAAEETLESFTEVLEKTPYLNELEAVGLDVHDAFFERLAATSLTRSNAPVSEVFLPLLCVLSLSGIPCFKWSSIPPIFSPKDEDGDFFPRPLYSLELTFSSFFEGDEDVWLQASDIIGADVEARFKELREEGKEIYISLETGEVLSE
ncbi:unnamed protein product [Cyclocybe aegerita]|uniref:F-box domain-containing protein n=1 Tax=Cyclocybe aegerita TaxID=1973307 RepID=A0A8S0WG79_CYCAE|nr:unnamed protein product [Cyclocybe aegerita]